MAWTIYLSPTAVGQLERVPRKEQGAIVKAVDAMRVDPFHGNVKPLKDKKWKGRYRKRVGDYRVIFIPFPSEKKVEISAILRRSEKTYR